MASPGAPSLVVRSLAERDFDAWAGLWSSYLEFYKHSLADDVTANTWARCASCVECNATQRNAMQCHADALRWNASAVRCGAVQCSQLVDHRVVPMARMRSLQSCRARSLSFSLSLSLSLSSLSSGAAIESVRVTPLCLHWQACLR